MINVRNKEFIKTFGFRLRLLREKQDLSQEELANYADIPINQIGRIERGEVNTTISTLKAIADALKIEPKVLFEFDLTKKPK